MRAGSKVLVQDGEGLRSNGRRTNGITFCFTDRVLC